MQIKRFVTLSERIAEKNIVNNKKNLFKSISRFNHLKQNGLVLIKI